MLGFHHISSHFPCFLYATGTLPATALVLNPRVGLYAYILGPRSSFKRTLLRDWQFLSLSQTSLVFIARGYEALFLGAGTLGCVVWPGAGIACSPGVSSAFYWPQVNVGPPILLATTTASPQLSQCILSTPSLLPIWMNISCLNLWLLDFHTVRFSGSSGCILF